MRAIIHHLLPPPVGGPLFRPQLPDWAVMTADERREKFRRVQPPVLQVPTKQTSEKPEEKEETDSDCRVQW